jgi:hypothetical protein
MRLRRMEGRCWNCGRDSNRKRCCPKCRAGKTARDRGARDRSDGSINGPALDARLEEFGWRCGTADFSGCGQAIDPSLTPGHQLALQWDHIVPVSKGGAHGIENLQPMHARCNRKKHSKSGDAAVAEVDPAAM